MADTAQQRLATRRRDQILDAAAIVFAERGFHPTTIRDIARRAGIADGTIYNYFDSKAALLFGIFDRMGAAVRQEATPLTTGLAPRDFLRLTLAHPLKALSGDNLALFRIIVSEMMVNADLRARYNDEILGPTLAEAEALLRAQIVAWKLPLRPEDIGLTIRAVAGLIMGLLLTLALGDATLEARWDDLPDFIAGLIVAGLERSA